LTMWVLLQDPGKVWKGKKMPGHMGCKRRTQYNLRIVKINIPSQLIHVRGSIPGAKVLLIWILQTKMSNTHTHTHTHTHSGPYCLIVVV
jgi:ribosomal protein L3